MVANIPAVNCNFGGAHALWVVWIRCGVVSSAGRDGDAWKRINGCNGVYINGDEVFEGLSVASIMNQGLGLRTNCFTHVV